MPAAPEALLQTYHQVNQGVLPPYQQFVDSVLESDDDQLVEDMATHLHENHYSRIPREEFDDRIGMTELRDQAGGDGVLDWMGNVARGAGERAAEIAGGAVEVLDKSGRWLEDKVPLGTIDLDTMTYHAPGEGPRDKGQKSALATAAKGLRDLDLGYKPSITGEEFLKDPVSTWVPFFIEQGLISLPDMAAAIFALPGYVVARTGEIGYDRAQNNNQDEPTMTDLVNALPWALATAMLEQVGAKLAFGIGKVSEKAAAAGGRAAGRKLGPAAERAGRVLGRGVAGGVGEAATEFAQEVAEYLGGHLGTEKGVEAGEAIKRGVIGAAVGAGVGGTLGAASGAVRETTQRQPAADEPFGHDETAPPPETGPLPGPEQPAAPGPTAAEPPEAAPEEPEADPEADRTVESRQLEKEAEMGRRKRIPTWQALDARNNAGPTGPVLIDPINAPPYLGRAITSDDGKTIRVFDPDTGQLIADINPDDPNAPRIYEAIPDRTPAEQGLEEKQAQNDFRDEMTRMVTRLSGATDGAVETDGLLPTIEAIKKLRADPRFEKLSPEQRDAVDEVLESAEREILAVEEAKAAEEAEAKAAAKAAEEAEAARLKEKQDQEKKAKEKEKEDERKLKEAEAKERQRQTDIDDTRRRRTELEEQIEALDIEDAEITAGSRPAAEGEAPAIAPEVAEARRAANQQKRTRAQEEIDRLTERLGELEGTTEPGEPGAGPAPKAGEVRPVVYRSPLDGKEYVGYERVFSPDELSFNPEVFQFKTYINKTGETGRLGDVKTFNPLAAGVLIVYERQDGTTFEVVDGHQRANLGKRLHNEDPDSDIEMRAVVFREVDGISESEVRILAAQKNALENNAEAIDLARLEREWPGALGSDEFSSTQTKVRQATKMARLGDNAFNMAINEAIPNNYLAMVGDLVPMTEDGMPDDPLQSAIIAKLSKERPANETEALSMIRDLLSVPVVRGEQTDIFGALDVAVPLIKERAAIRKWLEATLKTDKKTFKTLRESVGSIERAGNVLAKDKNLTIEQEVTELLDHIMRSSHLKGPTSKAINDGAERLGEGEKIEAVGPDVLQDIARGLGKVVGDGPPPGGAREGGEEGDGGGSAAPQPEQDADTAPAVEEPAPEPTPAAATEITDDELDAALDSIVADETSTEIRFSRSVTDIEVEANRRIAGLSDEDMRTLAVYVVNERKRLVTEGQRESPRAIELARMAAVIKVERDRRKNMDPLKGHGLSVHERSGAWHVTGEKAQDTIRNKETLKALGGRYLPAKRMGGTQLPASWVFSYDPSAALLEKLGPTPTDRAVGRNDGGVIDEGYASRGEIRGVDVNPEDWIAEDTRTLLRRGEAKGMPAAAVADQITDAAAVVQAFANDRPMFLLAGEAGSGKTFVIAAAIREMQRRGAADVLYITRNREIIKQNEEDMAPFVMSPVRFATYASLSAKNGAEIYDSVTEDTVLVLDESHSVKNLGPEATHGPIGQKMMKAARFTVMASATPYENPAQARYLQATGVFDEEGSFFKWGSQFGVTSIKIGNVTDYEFQGRPVDSARAQESLARKGVFSYRPVRLPPGMVDTGFEPAKIPLETYRLYARVDMAYAIASNLAESRYEAEMIAAHRLATLKRIVETGKVEKAADLAKKAVAEGRQAVVFIETVAERWLGRYRRNKAWLRENAIFDRQQVDRLYGPKEIDSLMSAWEDMAARFGRKEAPPPPFSPFIWRISQGMMRSGVNVELPSVKENIGAMIGDTAVMFTGEEGKRAEANKAAFLSGEKKVLIATMAKGGTGLSLHDTVGDSPRSLIGLNLPWTATEMDQVLGRIARYGMQSKAHITWLWGTGIATEREIAGRVQERMENMGALVRTGAPKITDIIDSERTRDKELDADKADGEWQIDIDGKRVPDPDTGETPLFSRGPVQDILDTLPPERPDPAVDPDIVQAIIELAQTLTPQTTVEIYDKLADPTGKHQVGGMYWPAKNVIQVALDSGDVNDVIRVYRHEAVHAMRQMGLFTRDEWTTLEKAARQHNWFDEFNLRTRYPEFFADDGTPYEEAYEEAVAEAYGHYMKDSRGIESALKRLFDRIREFFAKLVAHLRNRGYETPWGVFDRMDAGVVGSRGWQEAMAVRTAGVPKRSVPMDFNPKMAAAIRDAPMEKASGKEWLRYLTGKKAQVGPVEIKDAADFIRQLAQRHDVSTTRADIQSLYYAHAPQIDVTVFKSAGKKDETPDIQWQQSGSRLQDELASYPLAAQNTIANMVGPNVRKKFTVVETGFWRPELTKTYNAFILRYDDSGTFYVITGYDGSYIADEASNLTEARAFAQERLGEHRNLTRDTRWHGITHRGPKENYAEYLFKNLAVAEPHMETRTHWRAEPGVFAHMRVSERAVGNQSMHFIEEIQSDLHQAWQKEVARQAKFIGRKMAEETTPTKGVFHGSSNWTKLALKQALKTAVDEGRDYIAFAGGRDMAIMEGVWTNRKKRVGMATFYDKVLPNVFRGYAKRQKWDMPIEDRIYLLPTHPDAPFFARLRPEQGRLLSAEATRKIREMYRRHFSDIVREGVAERDRTLVQNREKFARNLERHLDRNGPFWDRARAETAREMTNDHGLLEVLGVADDISQPTDADIDRMTEKRVRRERTDDWMNRNRDRSISKAALTRHFLDRDGVEAEAWRRTAKESGVSGLETAISVHAAEITDKVRADLSERGQPLYSRAVIPDRVETIADDTPRLIARIEGRPQPDNPRVRISTFREPKHSRLIATIPGKSAGFSPRLREAIEQSPTKTMTGLEWARYLAGRKAGISRLELRDAHEVIGSLASRPNAKKRLGMDRVLEIYDTFAPDVDVNIKSPGDPESHSYENDSNLQIEWGKFDIFDGLKKDMSADDVVNTENIPGVIEEELVYRIAEYNRAPRSRGKMTLVDVGRAPGVFENIPVFMFSQEYGNPLYPELPSDFQYFTIMIPRDDFLLRSTGSNETEAQNFAQRELINWFEHPDNDNEEYHDANLWEDYTHKGKKDDYRAILFQDKQHDNDAYIQTRTHWGEEPGVFAHMRVSTRKAGNRSIFLVEEVQSDVHQNRSRDDGSVRPPLMGSSSVWGRLALKQGIAMAAAEGHNTFAIAGGTDMAIMEGLANNEQKREGIAKFYDQLLPNVFNAYAKRRKWGVKMKTKILLRGNDDTSDRMATDEEVSAFLKAVAERRAKDVKLLHSVIVNRAPEVKKALRTGEFFARDYTDGGGRRRFSRKLTSAVSMTEAEIDKRWRRLISHHLNDGHPIMPTDRAEFEKEYTKLFGREGRHEVVEGAKKDAGLDKSYNPLILHSVEITDAMRKDLAERPQPLYSRRVGEVPGANPFRPRLRKAIETAKADVMPAKAWAQYLQSPRQGIGAGEMRDAQWFLSQLEDPDTAKNKVSREDVLRLYDHLVGPINVLTREIDPSDPPVEWETIRPVKLSDIPTDERGSDLVRFDARMAEREFRDDVHVVKGRFRTLTAGGLPVTGHLIESDGTAWFYTLTMPYAGSGDIWNWFKELEYVQQYPDDAETAMKMAAPQIGKVLKGINEGGKATWWTEARIDPREAATDYKEQLFQPEVQAADEPFEQSQNHWGNTAGVFAHMRTETRTVDGKRTYIMSEIQSDVHQKGGHPKARMAQTSLWAKLAVRHALRDAAANGHDAIAFIGGFDMAIMERISSIGNTEGIMKFYDEVLAGLFRGIAKKHKLQGLNLRRVLFDPTDPQGRTFSEEATKRYFEEAGDVEDKMFVMANTEVMSEHAENRKKYDADLAEWEETVAADAENRLQERLRNDELRDEEDYEETGNTPYWKDEDYIDDARIEAQEEAEDFYSYAQPLPRDYNLPDDLEDDPDTEAEERERYIEDFIEDRGPGEWQREMKDIFLRGISEVKDAITVDGVLDPDRVISLVVADLTPETRAAILAADMPLYSRRPEPHVRFDDPETEQRWQTASEGIKPESALDRIKTNLAVQWKRIARHREHLPENRDTADIVERMLHLEAQTRSVSEDIAGLFDRVTKGLNETDIDLIQRKMVLDDLRWTAQQGMDLPYGLQGEEDVGIELAKIDEAIAGRPDLAERLTIRQNNLDSLRKEMIRHEVLPAERLRNTGYFRHMVLEYAEARAKGGGSGKVRSPHWHARHGSEKDINANWFQAEADWMLKAKTDIATMRFLNWLEKSKYNHLDRFRQRARSQNNAHAMQTMLDEISRETAGLDGDLRGRVMAKAEDAVTLKQIGDNMRSLRADLKDSTFDQAIEKMPLLQDWWRLTAAVGQAIGRWRFEVKGMSEEERSLVPERLQPILRGVLGDRSSADAEESIFLLMNWLIGRDDMPFVREASLYARGAVGRRQNFIREKLIGDNWVNPRDAKVLIREFGEGADLAAWQPDSYDGKTRAMHIYTAKSVPEHVVDRLMDEMTHIYEELTKGRVDEPISPEIIAYVLRNVRDVQAVGGPKTEFIVSGDIARTLDNFHDEEAASGLDAIARTVTNLWKQWVLFNPYRFAKYYLNNMSGDIDAIIANPSGMGILRKVPAATRMINRYMYGDHKAPTLLADAIDKGIIHSALTTQEIHEAGLHGPMPSIADMPRSAVIKIAKRYFHQVRKLARHRENVVRLAAYLHYREAIIDQNKPMDEIGFGATPPWMIKGITDQDDLAARMARDALGDYGNISVTGRWARQRVLPFVSWLESNTRRYANLFRNAWLMGRFVSPRKGLTAGTATSVALLARIGLFYGIIQAVNNLWHGEDEEQLSSEERIRMHLNLGRTSDGQIRTLRFQGAFSDFAGWFGMEDAGSLIHEVQAGRADLGDVLSTVAKAPVNKLVQGVNPIYKLSVETAFGRRFFPDVFNPRELRDPWKNFARTFSLEEEIAQILKRMGVPAPSRGYTGNPLDLISYKRDPGQIAYDNTRARAYQWLSHTTGGGSGRGQTTYRSKALYDWRLSQRYQDPRSAAAARGKMQGYGVTGTSMGQMVRRAHPLGMLNARQRRQFYGTLSARERDQLKRANRWYVGTYGR